MQLRHEEKETTWENHGSVALSGPSGPIAREEQFQHNRQIRNIHEKSELLCSLAVKAKASFETKAEQPPIEIVKQPTLIGRLLRWVGIYRPVAFTSVTD